MRLGALLVDEIKSHLIGSPRSVPRAILECGRQAVNLIAAARRFSARFKTTQLRHGVEAKNKIHHGGHGAHGERQAETKATFTTKILRHRERQAEKQPRIYTDYADKNWTKGRSPRGMVVRQCSAGSSNLGQGALV